MKKTQEDMLLEEVGNRLLEQSLHQIHVGLIDGERYFSAKLDDGSVVELGASELHTVRQHEKISEDNLGRLIVPEFFAMLAGR